MERDELKQPYWILKIAFGVLPIVAGLDKFTNFLTNWAGYLSPQISRIVPAGTFMHLVGVIEIVAGALVLSKFTRIGAYIVAFWLVAIALNLLSTGFYDVAVRDLVMAAGSFTLAKLAEARSRRTIRSEETTRAEAFADSHA